MSPDQNQLRPENYRPALPNFHASAAEQDDPLDASIHAAVPRPSGDGTTRTSPASAPGATPLRSGTKGKSRASATAQGSIVRLTDPQDAVPSDEDVDDDDQPDEPSRIATDLAPEILIKVFSFLDPYSLSRSAAVCRAWALVARDDATWRSAFANYFNVEMVHTADDAGQALTPTAVPSLRRLTWTSWRSEFQRRTELHRRWKKSRAPTVLSMPRVDIIDSISVSKQHTFMLSSSRMYGVASRSNPFTGKVTKGYLDAEGTANGAGNGNPNIEFSPNVTALAMGADANNVAWGFRSGQVGLTTLTRQGINPRGTVKSHQFSPRGCHVGPVSAVAVPFASGREGVHGAGRSPERLRQQLGTMGDVANTFVTAGHDGTVRLWSPLRALPIWMGSTASRGSASDAAMHIDASTVRGPGGPSPICSLDYDAKAGIIAAGSSNGRVTVWYNLDVAALLAIRPEASNPEQSVSASVEGDVMEVQERLLQQLLDGVSSVTIELPEGSGAETAIGFLRIDAEPPSGPSLARLPRAFSVLAWHLGARVFLRHRIEALETDKEDGVPSDRAPVTTTVFGNMLMGEISTIKPDFEPRSSHVKSSVTPSPMASTLASPALAASLSESSAHVPRLDIGPPPFATHSAGQYPEKKFVSVGTKAGSIHIFDWEADGTIFDQAVQENWQGHRPARFRGSKQVPSARTFEAHHTAITSLEVSALHLFAGTSDGTIKVFCLLSADLIRTINDRTATRHPARMLAAGELTEDEAARFRVKQIVADHDSLIAAIGHQVLAFRAEPLQRAKDRKLAVAAKKGAKPSARTSDSKFQMQVDLRRDLRESQAQLQAEREERQAQYTQMKSKANDHGLGDMTEQEAFEYAMMLSKDEEEAKVKALSQSQSQISAPRPHASGRASSSKAVQDAGTAAVEDLELADALEQIALAESRQESHAPSRSSSALAKDRSWSLEDQYASGDSDMDGDDDDDTSHHDDRFYIRSSTSASPSPHASPNLSGVSSPSRAWTILNQAGPSRRFIPIDRSHPESKIRTINVPRASLSPPLDAHEGLPVIGSPQDWPTMSPSAANSPYRQTYGRSLSSTTSSVRGASPLDTPSRLGGGEGWALHAGAVAGQGGDSSGKRVNMGAWANSSPDVRPRRSPPAESLLAATLGSGTSDHGSGGGTGTGLRSSGSALVHHPPASSPSLRPSDAPTPEAEMDDDLRFAIELSLAEDRSRQEREPERG